MKTQQSDEDVLPGSRRACQSCVYRRAFTLVELLVVTAIIAILAALLLPSLSRARGSAHSAVCKSNLRQWGVALRLYLDNFGSYVPNAMLEPPTQAVGFWYWRLGRCIGVPDADLRWAELPDPITRAVAPGRAKGILVCPGLALTPVLDPSPSGPVRYIGSYGYNAFGYGSAYDGASLGLGGRLLHGDLPEVPENIRLIRESEVHVPSDMIAIGDVMIIAEWGGAARYTHPELWPYYPETQADLGLDDSNPLTVGDLSFFRGAVSRRHGGRWNMLFCDSHVESGKTGAWFDPRKEAVRMRWNSDNLPHTELGP